MANPPNRSDDLRPNCLWLVFRNAQNQTFNPWSFIRRQLCCFFNTIQRILFQRKDLTSRNNWNLHGNFFTHNSLQIRIISSDSDLEY